MGRTSPRFTRFAAWTATLVASLLSASALRCTANAGTGQNAGDDPASPCGTNRFHLSGAVDGITLRSSYLRGFESQPVPVDAGLPYDHSIGFGTNGSLKTTAQSADSPATIIGGTVVMPDEGPLPGVVFCVGQGQVTRTNSNGSASSFLLQKLSKRGKDCPGVPIPGEISGCWGQAHFTE